MFRACALALLLTAAACSDSGTPAPEGLPGMPQECDATRYAALVGEPAEDLDLDHAGPVRVLAPDSMMTMDYRTDRLNVRTDDKGIVTAFFCG